MPASRLKVGPCGRLATMNTSNHRVDVGVHNCIKAQRFGEVKLRYDGCVAVILLIEDFRDVLAIKLGHHSQLTQNLRAVTQIQINRRH